MSFRYFDTAASIRDKEVAAFLYKYFVFFLCVKALTFSYNLQESNDTEKEAVASFVEKVVKEKEISTIEQGEEPDEFWDALGRWQCFQ